ncbi:hypothetical protein VZ95_20310 [Elstera litoralis]|uniref:CobQ/CobB/MinD/ParA nucleotide binding domain-containing protein n=1 Tax=Elstera litoralis TaxID=552518 RepID=A0A0F3IK47_9PROT|nr:hypothetical protein [Elstera litoralis]KJV07066.1 hypothetical protein VZ95_20310 [Elstera litoralis]
MSLSEKLKYQNLVISVNGQKGGSGKSTATRGIAENFIANGINFYGVDADGGNADFFRFYPDKTIIQNLDSEDDFFKFTNEIEKKKLSGNNDPVLISMPARANESDNKHHELIDSMKNELGLNLVLFWVLNRDLDGVSQLKFALDNFGYLYSKVIIVKNGFFGEPDDFRAWDDSKTKKRALEELGGAEIYMPKLNPGLANKVLALRQEDRIRGYGMQQIIDSQLVGLGERAALRKWLNTFGNELNSVFA